MGNLNEVSSLQCTDSPNDFPNLMFRFYFKNLDDFLVFWIDDLLIYTQTEKEHLKHIQLVLKSSEGIE